MEEKKLGKITLYETKESEALTDFESFVLLNQKSDLKKQKKLSLDLYARELVFFDLFMKGNKVNKKFLEYNTNKKSDKISKIFRDEFLTVNTPSEKNYEKKLIEKLTNKIIIEYLKNGDYNDRRDYYIVRNTLRKIEEIKKQYREIGYDYIEKYDREKQIEITRKYQKVYQKLIQKNLKSRYRLCKKYAFLKSE